MLNDKCGVDFHGQGEEDDYPSDMSTDYPPEFPTEDPNGENGGDPCQAWVESEEAMTNAEACAAITDPQGDCPEGCQAYIEVGPHRTLPARVAVDGSPALLVTCLLVRAGRSFA